MLEMIEGNANLKTCFITYQKNSEYGIHEELSTDSYNMHNKTKTLQTKSVELKYSYLYEEYG